MGRRLMTIKYDGSNYCGWQVQPNGVSVQATVQEALGKILGLPAPGISGCSRTDAGVHANMFCFHFDTESKIDNERIVLALNSYLPDDIAAVCCRDVNDDFHARYNSSGKTYVYKILNSRIRDPFKEKYYLQFIRHIDEELLNDACKAFLGTHDFKGFCSVGSSVTDTVRTVTECSVIRNGDDVIFKITANGFLYNMVRIIVGTLLDVTLGKINPLDLHDIIDSTDRSKAGATAPAHGLYLDTVHYD